MKQKLLISLAMVIATLAMAGTPEQEIANRIHYVFAKLNKNEVPTGVLSNYGVQPIDLEYYNGIPADSNYVDLHNFTLLYAGLYTSKINNKISLLTPDEVARKIETANSSTVTPVAFMNYRYNKLREDAVDRGLVKVVNDQIIRIPNTVFPYETKTLFAVTPQKVHYNAARVAFVFKPNLKFGNTTKTVRNFQIRFDTSLAYRTISWNTTIAHTYANSGVKHLRFRVNYTDGTSLESQTNIFVKCPPLTTKNSFSSRFNHPLKKNSKHSGGTLQIQLAPSNHSGKIRKALIVAEGFDAMQIMGKDNMDITDFLKEKNEFGSINYYKISPNLYSELQANDYDIVYLDYNDGVDDIRRNAALLREAISWVNSNKQGNEPNVVMGISMGGLVARYALSKMEAEGEEHNTWKYISIDSPHKGANVPVGLQAAVQHIASQRLKLFFIKVLKSTWLSDDLDNALEILNSKAAKQMLIYRVAGSGSSAYDNSEYKAFMKEYEELGFPKKCQNVAVSNGNDRGNRLFNSGATLLDYQEVIGFSIFEELVNQVIGTSLSGIFIFSNHPELLLNVLPGKTQLGVSFSVASIQGKDVNRVYHGKIRLKKKIFWLINATTTITEHSHYTQSSMLPIDNIPGGIYDIEKIGGSSVNGFLPYLKQKQFCFVPTVSALALENWESELTNNLTNRDLFAEGKTNFEYRYSPNSSEIHTAFKANTNFLREHIKAPLPAPTNLTATNIRYNDFILHWTAAEGATNYEVYTISDYTDTDQLLANTTETELSITNLKMGETCKYAIKSKYQNRVSDYSDTLSVTTVKPEIMGKETVCDPSLFEKVVEYNIDNFLPNTTSTVEYK